MPVNLHARAAIAASVAKNLAEHALGVVPVTWLGSWAVVVLEASHSRYVLARSLVA